MRTGRCLCGDLRYEVDGEPVVVAHCHCTDCQRLSGAAHTTGAMFPVDSVRVFGRTSEFRLESGAGNVVTRTFCPTCGSPLFGRNDRMPGVLTLTVGTLDDPESVRPQVVVYARSRRSWDQPVKQLPTFETQPDWKPADGV